MLQTVGVSHSSQKLAGNGAENLDIWTEPLSDVQCSRILCIFKILRFSHKMRPHDKLHDTQVEAFCTTEYAHVESTNMGFESFMVVKRGTR
jgi:hypothetical protein